MSMRIWSQNLKASSHYDLVHQDFQKVIFAISVVGLTGSLDKNPKRLDSEFQNSFIQNSKWVLKILILFVITTQPDTEIPR